MASKVLDNIKQDELNNLDKSSSSNDDKVDNKSKSTNQTNSDDEEPAKTLDNINFNNLDEARDKRRQTKTVSDILLRDDDIKKGEFVPNVEEFREYESFFGTNITQGDDLSAEKIDPRFQDLPEMRAKAQGLIDSTGKDALKTIPQTLTQAAELAGYIGDVQAYDDVFRGLINYVSQKASGEPVVSEDYDDVGNWLSEAARETSTAVDEMLPVYRQDPSKVWAPGDPAWWSTNIANLVETVGAFGGVSGAASRGIGAVARGIAKGIGTGAKVNTLRGGAKMFKYADNATTAGTTLTTSYAEGMLVGMQNYKKTFKKEKQKLIEQGVSETEAIKRAKEAAGQAAATTAGINSVILPFLNLTGAATLTRGRRSASKLTNEALERTTGEGFENIGKYAKRIKETDGGINFVSREASELARESALESAEELSARISEVEGQYIDEKDAPSVGERLSEAIFSPQSALEATLGAIAGAGQQGIMRSLPTIDDPSGEGKVSRRQLEWQRDAEYAAKDKKELEERVDEMVEVKDLLAEAKELENDGETKKAQRKRDTAMNKLRANITADNISRGVEDQMRGIYRSIENMDEEQAEQMGFDTDRESDQYYKDAAREERKRIEKYKKEYDELNEQYNFTTKEEFANVPKTLLNLSIQEDNAERRAEELKEEKNRLDEERPTDEEFDRQAKLDVEREIELQNLREQRDAVQEMKEMIESWPDQVNEDYTFGEIVEDDGREKVQNVRENLPDELFESLKDLKPKDALEFAEYVIGKRESKIDELDNKKTQAYENFLDKNNLEDNQENRMRFQASRNQVKEAYKDAYEKLDQAESYAELRADINRKRFNYFTSRDGREQLLKEVKGFFEDVKEKSNSEAKAAIRNARTVEEVDNLLNSFPELVTEQVEELAQQRKEEIKTAQNKQQESDRMDPDSQEAKEQEEEIADNLEAKAEKAQKEQEEKQQETTEENTEEDQSFRDRVKNMFSESQEEGQEEDTDTTTETEEDQSTSDVEELGQALRDAINRYIDNREFESEEQVEEQVKNFINNWVKERDALKSVLNENDDLRNSLIRQAIDRYKRNKSVQEMRDEAGDDVDPADRPLENVSDEKENMSSEDLVSYEGAKVVESGSSVTYKAVEYSEESIEREFVLDKNGEIDQDLTDQLRRYKNLADDPDVDEITQQDLQEFRDNHQIKTKEVVRKQPVSNERIEGLEYPKVELPDVMTEGSAIEYRILTREQAEEQGFDEESLENSTFREDIDDLSQENIDSAAIGIYHNTNLVGYLRIPQSITEETTATNIEGVADNIEKNRSLNRGIRKTVLSQWVNENNVRVPGKVTEKWPGHLTINRDENGNRQIQKIKEAFPDQDVTFFVTRYGEPYVNASKSVSTDALMNSEKFFENNEGSAGIIVTMGNGERLAVPIWLPTLGEIDADGDTIVETLYQIGKRSIEGEQVTGPDGFVDLSNHKDVEDQISRYVYTTSEGIYDLLQSEGKRQVHVVSSEKGVAVVNQRTGEVFHTNEGLVETNDDFQSWTENEERVKELLSQMRFNVDLDNINQQKDATDRDEKVVKANDDGELELRSYETQNDLIKEYAETDLDASYEIQGQHLVYQRPTVNTRTDLGGSVSDTNPDVPNNTGSDNGPSESAPSAESESEIEHSERDTEDNVQGDTNDVRSSDIDQTTTPSDSKPFDSLDDLLSYGEESELNKLLPLKPIEEVIKFGNKEEYRDEVVNPALEKIKNRVQEDLSMAQMSFLNDSSFADQYDEIIDRMIATYNKYAVEDNIEIEEDQQQVEDEETEITELTEDQLMSENLDIDIKTGANVRSLNEYYRTGLDNLSEDDLRGVKSSLESLTSTLRSDVGTGDRSIQEVINKIEPYVELFNERVQNEDIDPVSLSGIEAFEETETTEETEPQEEVEGVTVGNKKFKPGDNIRIYRSGRTTTHTIESISGTEDDVKIQYSTNDTTVTYYGSMSGNTLNQERVVREGGVQGDQKRVSTFDTLSEVKGSAKVTLSKSQESKSEKTTLEKAKEDYRNISTFTDQETDDLKNSIDSLEKIISDLEDEGISYENDFYEKVKVKKSNLVQELESRGEVNEEQQAELDDNTIEGMDDALGLNQMDLSQNTYTEQGVLTKEMNTGQSNISESVIQTQFERDVAEGKLNVKCKR